VENWHARSTIFVLKFLVVPSRVFAAIFVLLNWLELRFISFDVLF